MVDIHVIQRHCEDNRIRITKHAAYRIEERGISFDQIKSGIMNGEIIEEYPTDFPNPSVLLLGYTSGNPLHIVVGISDMGIQLITAYHPSDVKWEADFRTRKEGKL